MHRGCVRPATCRRAVLVLLTAVVLFPTRADAAHWIDCDGNWKNSGTSCELAIRGLPVQISGWSETSSGTARVHVWLTVATPTGEEIIAECESSGARYASCSDDLGIGEYVDPFIQSVPVTCHVEGRGSGYFICASYAGPGA